MPMNEIQVARYNAVLHKLLAMKEGAPAPLLAPEIFAMIALEVDRPEWAFLGNERLSQGAYAAAGAAAKYTMVGLWNPAGSDTLMIVDQITVLPASAAILYTNMSTRAEVLTSWSQASALRDSRLHGLGSAGSLFYHQLAVVPGEQLDYWKVPSSASTTRSVEYVLSPGYALFVYNTTANVGLSAALRWRERGMEPSESR